MGMVQELRNTGDQAPRKILVGELVDAIGPP